jgi:hypothetical protein
LGEGDTVCTGSGAHGMHMAFTAVAAATQGFAGNGNLIVGEDDSGLLEMVDDALAEEIGNDGFEDACEGVVTRDAVGQRDRLEEPVEANFAELLHEFVGFYAA